MTSRTACAPWKGILPNAVTCLLSSSSTRAYHSDTVTCGGCQSAHTAALAVGCAERGIKAHLLLRGERPEIPTGYNLISEMFGNVVYVPRSAYANREAILEKHASFVAGVEGTIHELYDLMDFLPVNSTHCHNDRQSTRKVAIVKEGAGDTIALLGTTAIGIALGVYLLGLPWKVTGVMLAGSAEGYRRQESQLLSEFKKLFVNHKCEFHMDSTGLVEWTDRLLPRKFGNVLEGELELCKRISQQSGILLDPVYTLASWEHAVRACQSTLDTNSFVVMLHTGGTLGIFGLAQRYKSYFQKMK